MEAERREELARWAHALEGAEGEEQRAAGRAIATLCETPEQLGPAERRELERWTESLAGSQLAELRAAGRAIRTLCADGAAPAAVPDEPPAGKTRPPRLARKPIAVPWRALGIAGAAFVLVGGAAVVAARAAAPELGATGPAAHSVVGRAALASLSFSARDAQARWTLDGRPVTPKREGSRYVFAPRKLADGEHVLVVSREGRMFSSATRKFPFVVDTEPPVLRLDRPATVQQGRPLVVRGRLEPGARLVRDGKPVAVDDHGRFVVRSLPVAQAFRVDATDAAGNTSLWRVPVTIAPRRPAQPVRSVHVTAYGWADKDLRQGVLALVKAKKINAVELDLKDEAGEIGWNPDIPLARRMHAALPIYDLGKAVRQLHAQGVRVIGRLVCFRDPIHAAAAWKAGRRSEVIQTPNGGPYAGYGGFTNFANPAVRRYNIDVAVAAARLGVDEILYDYVRRPDGPIGSMVFPGLRGTPEQGIVRFLAESEAALDGTKALFGASVFGVAATRPTEVAQDIPAMARHLDYVAPMVYPSHWGPGEYDVADPNGSPYEIVRRSTLDFVKQVRGTGARVMPWLQDFSLGRDYGPAEVRAQIRGARDAGAGEFLLWDPAVSYTTDALDPTAATPALSLTTDPPKDAPGPVRLPDPKPAPKSVAKPAGASKQPRPGLAVNELGQIPIVMHHMVRPDRVGDYDQTPAEFRAELETLWRQGYVPVGIGDLVTGRLDVPKGMTPVGFTFDDSTRYQLALRADGTVKPDTAVGIMLDFARTHPGFVPAGTFYVNREPFGGVEESDELLRWLVENGFELGNHTHDHLPLRNMSDAEVQRQLATGEEVIHRVLPDYRVETMALPLGSMPKTARLARRGAWHGTQYGPFKGVLLVGANPTASPYSRAFDPTAVPRLRSSHAGWNGERDFAFSYWMAQLQRNPEARFVSDGDPKTISVPAGSESSVRPAFRSRLHVVR